MNIRALSMVLMVWPACGLSDTWVPIVSEIPGLQLWELGGGKSSPVEVYEGEDNEFMPHGNRGLSIHVSTLDAPVKCRFTKEGGFYSIHVETTDKRVMGQRLALVSKSPIPPKVKPLVIGPEEIDKLKKAEHTSAAEHDRRVQRLFAERNKGSTDKEHLVYVSYIRSSATYRKHIGARFKLPSPNGSLYVSSVGLNSSEFMGREIINVVYREIDGKMREIGMFEGCIQGGFRDLDSDGTPEFLTRTCEDASRGLTATGPLFQGSEPFCSVDRVQPESIPGAPGPVSARVWPA